MIPAAHEADELQDHDERPGRRFGEAEAIHHLAGREPAVMGEGLLRDVGQNRVGAAESDDRRLAEKEAFLEKGVARA